MFTGLIEEIGTIRHISRTARAVKLTIACNIVRQDLKIGDSVAVNGACLTVVEVTPDGFAADVMPETVKRTALWHMQSGEAVNLERALRLGDRVGGHLVAGHIDGLGRIRRREQDDNALRLLISLDPTLLRYVVEKGSIAVDGISLTVTEVGPDYFGVSLIPHTAAVTTLEHKRVGDAVNIETDIIGKYVARLLGVADVVTENKPLDMELLRRYGYA